MELVRNFKNLNKGDVSLAGGKGASLGEMTQAGIPVPEGFVVLADTFDYFIDKTELFADIDAVLHKVNHQDVNSIENASEEIQSMILSSKMPKDIEKEVLAHFKKLGAKYVAVRSSATSEDSSTAAWAGQLDSFLNTTEKELLQNVKKCWASLFTPRAIFYRFEKNLHKHKISVAVVVQKMVESEVSGIAFSVHPVTQDYNQLIIESGLGLGEAIVSGQITPDSYVAEKKPLSVIEKNISEQTRALVKNKTTGKGNEWITLGEEGKKQKLPDKEIIALSHLIVEIENHYGFPCDIEWAREKGKFYIVQSRPITTLTQKEEVKKKGELIPDFFSNLVKFASRPMTLQRDEFGGIMWWNLCKGRFVSVPLDNNNRALYVEKEDTERGYRILASEMGTEQGWKKHLYDYYESVKMMEKTSTIANQKKFKSLKEMAKIFRDWMNAFGAFGRFNIAPFALEKILDPMCRELLKKEFGSNWESKFAAISTPSELNEYQKMRLKMLDAVIENKIKVTIPKLVSEYAWYSEYTYIEPLLDENYFKLELSKISKEQAKQEKEKLFDSINHNKKEFAVLLKSIKNKQLKLLAEVLHTYTSLRTDRIDSLKINQAKMRRFYDLLADELTKKTGKKWTRIMVVNCSIDELNDFMENEIIPDIEMIMKRVSHQYVYYYDGKANLIQDENSIKQIVEMLQAKESSGTEIKGTIAFKGKATGKVAIISSKKDLHKVGKGDVLVAKTTMPDYTPAMQIACAFVTEEGGITSHAAIVARELKKPCIVGTGNCTKVLKDGDLVEVNADNGIVKIIKRAEQEKELKLLDKFEGYKFLAEGGRSIYGYPNYCIVHTYSIDRTEWPLPIKGLIMFKNHLAKWYFVVKDESVFNPFLESYTKNPELLNKIERTLVFEREAFVKKISEKNLSLLSLNELSALASFYYSQFEKLVCLAGRLRYLDRAIVYNFRKAYPNADEYLRAISVSDEYSFVTKEEIEILEIALKCKKKKLSLKNKEVLDEVKKVFNKYTWYSLGYYNEKPKSLETYISLLNNFIEQDADVKIKEIHAKLKRELAHRNEIVSKLTKKEQKWAHIASRSTYLKDFYKYSISKIIFHAEPMFEEIAKRTRKTNDYVKDLIPEQTVKLLNGSLDENEVEEMLKHNVIYVHDGEFGIITGADAKQFEGRFLKIQDTQAKEFKGRGASVGHAKGIAKIIFSPKDFHKFNKGDILVAVNTSPDFVPLMKMAAAIVGEEGGLTSHTSVVSRELGVPCVVGITNVTSILEDGDLIEVDANKGIVRILKKAK